MKWERKNAQLVKKHLAMSYELDIFKIKLPWNEKERTHSW